MFVLVPANVNRKAQEILEKEGLKVKVIEESEVLENLSDAIALICRVSCPVTKEIIDKAPNLKVIARCAIGVDNIDIEYAKSKGIKVVHAPLDNTVTTAEYTIGMMIALLRHIPDAVKSVREGSPEKDKFTGTQLMGKTLGILGIGHIGEEVAKRAVSFGVKVVAYDPTPGNLEGVHYLDSMDDVLKESDIITLHLPLVESTRGMINKESFSKMKKGVYLINCARGGVVVENDLLEALNSGQVAGAALDVFEEEHKYGSELQRHAKVIATPHLGGSTFEALQATASTAAKQIIQILNGESAKFEI